MKSTKPLDLDPPGRITPVLILKVIIVLGLELLAVTFHYVAYSETLTLMPGTYLADIAGIAWLFAGMPDLTINHLVAAVMAGATVLAPVALFLFLMKERVLEAPGTFFANPANGFYLGLLVLFWGLMVSVEVTNILTMIDAYTQNPFARGEVTEALNEGRGFAIFITVALVLVNTALALASARLWFSLTKEEV